MMKNGPFALLDEDRVRHNIRAMGRKIRGNGLSFRPHFKTHQSNTIGQWAWDEGLEGIAIPSLRMATYFLENGWREQTVAFPLDPASVKAADELAARANMHFSISEGAPIEKLDRGFSREVPILIELDTGDGRTGFDPTRTDRIDGMIEALDQSRSLRFEGFLSHSGESYRARGIGEVRDVHERAMSLLSTVREHYRSRAPYISVGDTPTAALMEDFGEFDELRPGNFFFFDLMQERIGSCRIEDIAYCLSCPIVAKHSDRSELVIHGGAVHLSLDRLYFEDGTPYFGIPVAWEGDGWGAPYGGSWVARLSQEHGIVRASSELFQEKKVGDRLGILPVHSCLSADAMPAYFLLDGTRVEKFRG